MMLCFCIAQITLWIPTSYDCSFAQDYICFYENSAYFSVITLYRSDYFLVGSGYVTLLILQGYLLNSLRNHNMSFHWDRTPNLGHSSLGHLERGEEQKASRYPDSSWRPPRLWAMRGSGIRGPGMGEKKIRSYCEKFSFPCLLCYSLCGNKSFKVVWLSALANLR